MSEKFPQSKEIDIKSYDIVIVGGGVVGAYAVWRLAPLGLRVIVIDKADFEAETGTFFESSYYAKVEGYRKKGIGGLSSFWGGQIQSVEVDDIKRILHGNGHMFNVSEIAAARKKIVEFFEIDEIDEGDGNRESQSGKFNRILNRWLGGKRFFGMRILHNNSKVSVIKGKAYAIFSGVEGADYSIKYMDAKSETHTLNSRMIVFSAGLMGLAEFLLRGNFDKVLYYRDHYSISLGATSASGELGVAIQPLFVGRQIVTPRIYFTDIHTDTVSLYASIPMQRELGMFRNKLRRGLLSALTYILFNRKFLRLSFVFFKFFIAFITQSRVPAFSAKLNVNAFIDSGLVRPLSIKMLGNEVFVEIFQENDFGEIKDRICKTIQMFDLNLKCSSNYESYFDCGYHAYGLLDNRGQLASGVLTGMGVRVLGASELNNIGDRNPVFMSLVYSELQLNRLIQNEQV